MNCRDVTGLAGLATERDFGAPEIETTEAAEKPIPRDYARKAVHVFGCGPDAHLFGPDQNGDDLAGGSSVRLRGQRSQLGFDRARPGDPPAPEIGVADETGHIAVGRAGVDFARRTDLDHTASLHEAHPLHQSPRFL